MGGFERDQQDRAIIMAVVLALWLSRRYRHSNPGEKVDAEIGVSYQDLPQSLGGSSI
jgi:hypothetical protein